MPILEKKFLFSAIRFTAPVLQKASKLSITDEKEVCLAVYPPPSLADRDGNSPVWGKKSSKKQNDLVFSVFIFKLLYLYAETGCYC